VDRTSAFKTFLHLFVNGVVITVLVSRFFKKQFLCFEFSGDHGKNSWSRCGSLDDKKTQSHTHTHTVSSKRRGGGRVRRRKLFFRHLLFFGRKTRTARVRFHTRFMNCTLLHPGCCLTAHVGSKSLWWWPFFVVVSRSTRRTTT
jgi:hypothetical protein